MRIRFLAMVMYLEWKKISKKICEFFSRDEDPEFFSTDPTPDPTWNRNEEKNIFRFEEYGKKLFRRIGV